ncbi:MAG: (2Fe-2S)-binding protein [Geminicoccaceae bacterium]|nr:(2Fe-2S)-binding protein [Geminicoccaceae bacterium]
MTRVAIVGAGPAGIRAAAALVEAGIRPVLLDEAARPGGQGYRTPSPGLDLDMAALMGSEAGHHARLHGLFAAIHDRVDYRPETLVWAVDGRTLHVATQGRAGMVAFDALLLATGATDRVVPCPGWTKPGVFTLGGAQAILKDQGCFIGRRVAFVGSSPLLLLAALQYQSLGAHVAAVVDTTPFGAKLAALPDLAASPRTLRRGIAYRTKLRAAGIPVHDGAAPVAIEGRDGVEGVRLRHGAREWTIACDAVALGHGLNPETQLADLAGAQFAYDPVFRQWLPETDADGRAGPSLYLAGDGAAIGGAYAAEASGTLAAAALLADHGRPQPKATLRRLRQEVARLRRFQRGLARAFAWPAGQAAALPDDATLCRCEGITAGEVRRAMAQPLGPREVNRVKAITRVGMGRCQGRICGPALADIVAAAAGLDHAAVGRLRGQAPVKPIPLALGAEPAG